MLDKTSNVLDHRSSITAFHLHTATSAHRSELHLRDRLPELLALDLPNLELECARLTRTVGTSECSCSPRRSTTDLRKVRELCERLSVSEGDVDNAVMR